MRPNFIVWHTSDSPYGTANLIRQWHQARGWRDIGYHGVVLNGVLTHEDWKLGRCIAWLDGSFEVGRIWDGDRFLEDDEVGAHVYGLNRESMGLCLIGKQGRYTQKLIETALAVTGEWMKQFEIPVAHVIGHYEVGLFKPAFKTTKSCPDIDMDFVRDAIRSNHDLLRLVTA